jgi:hypothetical protein
MSRFDPGSKRRWRRSRLATILLLPTAVLSAVASFLSAYPLPFSVPRVLVVLPAVIGLALGTLALVLIFLDLRQPPRQ